MSEWLIDILSAMWAHWCSPEFAWVRLILIGGIVGAVLGYLAGRDAGCAATLDDLDGRQEGEP